jgi:hypothetical protein
MGMHEDMGRRAGEDAKRRIENGENPAKVHKEELGEAIKCSVVVSLATVTAPVWIPALLLKAGWDKLNGK